MELIFYRVETTSHNLLGSEVVITEGFIPVHSWERWERKLDEFAYRCSASSKRILDYGVAKVTHGSSPEYFNGYRKSQIKRERIVGLEMFSLIDPHGFKSRPVRFLRDEGISGIDPYDIPF